MYTKYYVFAVSLLDTHVAGAHALPTIDRITATLMSNTCICKADCSVSGIEGVDVVAADTAIIKITNIFNCFDFQTI